MGPLTEEGCQKFKALHVIFRLAVRYWRQLKWKRLKKCTDRTRDARVAVGLPGQRVWPAIVSIDTHGNNLVAENKKLFANAAIPSWKRSASTSTTSNNLTERLAPLLFRRHNTMKPSTNGGDTLRRWRSSPLLLYFRFRRAGESYLALLCRFYWRDR